MKAWNFGSLNIDHVYRVDRFVGPGETLAARAYERFGGGKGFNQSIALARAGAIVDHVGNIGADGAWLVEMLEEAGVGVTHTRRVATPTGHAIIQVIEGGERAGENSILIHAGANHDLDAEQTQRALEGLEPGDVVLLQNEINDNAGILLEASRRGAHVALNPSPFDASLLDLPLDRIGTLILNEVEAGQLTGEPTLAHMIDALRERFTRAEIVLTLGAKGAVYVNASERFEVPAEPVTPVDTTGAGDTFTGYYLAGRLAGRSPRDAIEHASRAAALCVQSPGAAASIPTLPFAPAAT